MCNCDIESYNVSFIQTFAEHVVQLLTLMKENFLLAFWLLTPFWGMYLLNLICHERLNYLGIYPRHPIGLLGIFFSPFLHGSFDHLFFNTIPLFILFTLLPIYGFSTFITSTCIIIVFSGLLTWLFARKAIHIGASGLIMGYWGFLLAKAYVYPNINSLLIAFLVLYYLGSLWLNLFPSSKKVSWEGHLFGLIAGICSAWMT